MGERSGQRMRVGGTGYSRTQARLSNSAAYTPTLQPEWMHTRVPIFQGTTNYINGYMTSLHFVVPKTITIHRYSRSVC